MKQSNTETIIGALRILARDVQTDDGVANACLYEAAERMEYLATEYRLLEERMTGLHKYIANLENEIGMKTAVAAGDAIFTSEFKEEISRQQGEIMALRGAIEKTLAKNGHLADGEDCTLIDLKRALLGEFNPWVKIDYQNPETWPIESVPCLVAWDADSASDWYKDTPRTWECLAMRVPWDDAEGVEVGCGWLWAECFSGDLEDFDPSPTHWRYAPQKEKYAKHL